MVHHFRDVGRRSSNTEYVTVLEQLAFTGDLGRCVRSHLTPISEADARKLVASISPTLPVRFGSSTGRAYPKPYRISLPRERNGRLRVGVVLHEIAHIIEHQMYRTMKHGRDFCSSFSVLLREQPDMTDGSKIQVYMNHQGPFTGVAYDAKGKKIDLIEGHAQKVHDEACAAVSTGKAQDVFVYSNKEGQFIGAFYKRGGTYRLWSEDLAEYQAGLELPAQRPEAALLQGGDEPLRQVDDPVDASVPGGTVPGPRPVRSVPPKAPSQPRTPPPPRARVTLGVGKTEGWPKSEGATLVRGLMDDGTLRSSPEICEAIGAQLIAAGVQFPASLVSRLKQNGFLKEASIDA